MNNNVSNTSYSAGEQTIYNYMIFEHDSSFSVQPNQHLAFSTYLSKSYHPNQIAINFEKASLSYNSYVFIY